MRAALVEIDTRYARATFTLSPEDIEVLCTRRGHEVKIEIKRAPLPDRYQWVGNTITSTDGTNYVVSRNKVTVCYPASVRTMIDVPMAEIVDAFRAEGLL